MFCPQCGKEFPELAKFCPRCGYSVFEDIIDDKKASSEYSEKSGTGTFFGVTSQNTQTRVRAFQTGKYIRILLVAIVLVAGIFMLLQRVQQGRDSGSHEIAVGESVTFRSVDLSMQYAGAGVADINFNTQEALLFWGVYIDTSAEIQGVWIDNCEVDQANIGSYSSYSIEKIVDWNDYSAYPERVAEVTSTSFKNRLPLDSGKSDGYVISMAVPLDSLDIRLTLSVTDNIKVILVHPGKHIDRKRRWDAENEEWYFSVVDVVAVLTDQPDQRHAAKYWSVLKTRLKQDGSEQPANCSQLKMTAADGKRRLTDVADTE